MLLVLVDHLLSVQQVGGVDGGEGWGGEVRLDTVVRGVYGGPSLTAL